MQKRFATIFLSTFLFVSFLFSQPSIQWENSFGGSGFDQAQSVKQTSDGGYIVTGNTDSNDGDISGNHGSADIFVLKLSALGTIQWEKSIGGTGSEWANDIHQTNDGGYIIAGTSASSDGDNTLNHGFFDYWIVKIDSIGIIQWQKSYGGSDQDWSSSIQQTNEGGYIVTGFTQSTDGDVVGNHGGKDYWVLKLDTIGNLVWKKCFGGTLDETANSIKQTTDNGYIIAGGAQSSDGDVTGHHINPYNDYWIVKTDSLGNIQWKKCLGGMKDDYAVDIQQTLDSGFVVGGSSQSNDGDVTGHNDPCSCYDYWIVKITSAGLIQWQKSYGGNFHDKAVSLDYTGDRGYIILGTTQSNTGYVNGLHGGGSSPDYWVIKLDSSGNFSWQKCLGGSGPDAAFSIEQTSDGGYIMTGDASSGDGDVTLNHTAWEAWVAKLNCEPSISNFNGSSSSVCSGTMINFTNTSTGYVSYQWQINGVTFSTDINPNHLFSVAGTHTVTLIAGLGSCADTSFQTIVVKPLPVVSFSGLSSSNCVNSPSLNLIGSPSGGTFSGNGISGSIFNPSLATVGSNNINYTFTDTNGCTNIDTQTVNVFALPVTNISGIAAKYCINNSAVLITGTPSGGTFFGNGMSGNSFDPSTAGIGNDSIFYAFTDTNGCSDTSIKYVTINSLPVVSLSAFSNHCINDSAFVLSGESPAGGSFSGTGVSGSTFDPSVAGTGTQTIVYSYSDTNNCSNSASQTITVFSLPPTPTVTVVGSTTLCPGNTATLNSSSATGNLWSDNSSTTQTFIVSTGGIYFVTVSDTNGCKAVSSGISFLSAPNPAAVISGVDSICVGQASSLSVLGTENFLWSNGDTSSTINISPVVSALFFVTASNSCGAITDSIHIIVNPLPVVNAMSDTTIIGGTGIQLTASGSAGNYSWSPPTGLSCTACVSPISTPTSTTTYSVTITDANGCSANDGVVIYVDNENTIYIPNVFSPNDDLQNDVLYVRGKSLKVIHFVVYDRWGEKVFETNDLSLGWDGSYMNQKMNPAVFVYYVEATFLNDKKLKQKGDVTLVR